VNEPWASAASLRILADDLTGACDSAAPIASVSGGVPVFLGLKPSVSSEDPVWAIDLDVRDASPKVARDSARRAARSVDQQGRVFIKVDSSGRGPIRELLDGTSQGAPLRAVLLAPALPGQGTAVVGGRIRFRGHRSGDGPDLACLIEPEGRDGRPAHLIKLPVVRRGALALVRDIERAIDAGMERIIVDSDDEECLRAIAGAWLRLDSVGVAGSSGMARALASLAGPMRRPAAPKLLPNGPIVVVVGSPSPVAQGQVNNLLGTWPIRRTQQVPGSDSIEMSDDRDGVVVFQVRSESAERDRGEKARAVAEAAATWVNQTGNVGGVVLVGGTTARAFMTEMRVTVLEIAGEQSPGIARGRAMRGSDHTPLTFFTKSGGFGYPDALSHLLDELRKGSAPS